MWRALTTSIIFTFKYGVGMDGWVLLGIDVAMDLLVGGGCGCVRVEKYLQD